MASNMTRFGDLLPNARANGQTKDVLISGNLKKLGKIINLRGQYCVIGKTLYKNDNKSNRLIPAYDLADYSVALLRDNNYRFQLTPVNNNLRLEPVRFQASSVEERARWFKVLNYLTNESHNRVQNIHKIKDTNTSPFGAVEPGNLQSLQEI